MFEYTIRSFVLKVFRVVQLTDAKSLHFNKSRKIIGSHYFKLKEILGDEASTHHDSKGT